MALRRVREKEDGEDGEEKPRVYTDLNAHSEHRFPAPSSNGKEGCRKPVL